MATWALTGGAGFIGSQLTAALVSRGERVRSLVRAAVSAPQSGVEYVLGDVRDAASVSELVRGADVVVHLAAFVHKRAGSRRRRRECHSINVDGTRTVIASIAAHAPSAFLVHISTANVYPDRAEAADEQTQTRPRTYYGETKLESERLVLDAVAAGKVRGTILRPAMVFGPGAPGNLRRLVGFVQRGRILLVGEGSNEKSLAPVETLIAAVLAVVADAARTNGQLYNVSGGQLSMLEISQLIANELGITPRVVKLPAAPLKVAGTVVDAVSGWSSLPSISQMVTTYASPSVISAAKLRRLPSFRDPIDLEQALRTTIRALTASR